MSMTPAAEVLPTLEAPTAKVLPTGDDPPSTSPLPTPTGPTRWVG